MSCWRSVRSAGARASWRAEPCSTFQMRTSRSASGNGSGRRVVRLISVETEAVAAIPSAMQSTTALETRGDFRMRLALSRTSTVICMTSLLPQADHGVDAQRAPGGQRGGDCRDYDQQHRDAEIGQRVGNI